MITNDRINPTYENELGPINDDELAKFAKFFEISEKIITYKEIVNPCLKYAKTYEEYGKESFVSYMISESNHSGAKKRTENEKIYYKCDSYGVSNNYLAVGSLWR